MNEIHGGDALNLSTGKLTTFLNFAQMATECVGYSPDIFGDVSMPEGVASRGGDTSKQAKFGFHAEIPIEVGIAECIEYFQNTSRRKN
jgi:GDP-L-fucose synthase